MPLIAEAQIETDDGGRYLDELCRQLATRADANPDMGVRVDKTETDGSLDFGWARCAIHVTQATLELRAEAPDEDGLRQIRELVTRHLNELSGGDELPLVWQQDGAPISDSHEESRDAMRGFHQRMRNRH